MKKLLFSIFALTLISACNDENLHEVTKEIPTATNDIAGKRVCPSDKIRAEILKNDPEARARVAQIEMQYKDYVNDIKMGKVLADGTVEIPVVFNVIYKTAAQNVSDTRLHSQIDVLNKDFSGTNSDINQTPNEFKPALAGNTKIKFRLAKIVRKQNNTSIWNYDDNKMKKVGAGGIGATAPKNYLNIWIVNNMKDETLGYAYYPGTIGPALDGVVLISSCVGIGSGDPYYNLGRTATHEIGHYLNLAHIFGNGCTTDYCDDTPPSPGHSGAPTYPLYQNCGGVSYSQMFMNYMDYVDDASMYMFTKNQKQRMQAVVAASGPRSGLRTL